ncbi:MAG: ATP-binding protein [Eubacterium sp.]|nr:ATP-binding protein [Eubacterium sp.]
MGFYLNSKKPGLLFGECATATYFVDKSAILKDLIPLVESVQPSEQASAPLRGKGDKYICITRPRRFGKTVMANMISSYFGKGADHSKLFDTLAAASAPAYKKHLNKHNVIHIMLNEMPDECTSYKEYISRIKNLLMEDLTRAFPDAGIHKKDALWDALNKIIEFGDGEKFIFVLDEWDFIFHRSFITKDDQASYIGFLSSLLKDQPYVEFAYMTGILPIAKYSSGSELNMFFEYTMAGKEKYGSYFGFTDEEVDLLFDRYQSLESAPRVTRKGLKLWYDGYETLSGRRLYNPRSVTGALNDNQLGSYWTSSGPYDEIFYYLEHNVAKMRDDIALMVSGTPVSANIQEYAATSMNLTTRDEILSAMVVFGFLSCKDGMVSIPNLELLNRFADMLQKEPSLGYVHQLAKASARMLKATKDGDTKTMSKILEYAHHTESPLLCYSNEAELAAVIRLVYLEARNTYQIEREAKAGTGYADFLFYPKHTDDDCIILELKVNSTAKAAIQQIKKQNYALKFLGELGAQPVYTGRILAVGIAYQKKDNKHRCLIEVLRERI